MTIVLAVACWTLAAGGTVRAAARQSTAGALAISRLAQWIDAVRAHEIGEADLHAMTVGSWPYDGVAVVFPYLEALLQLVEAPTREDVGPTPQPAVARALPRPRNLYRLSTIEINAAELERLRTLAARDWVQADPNRLLKRGAMLHADIAMRIKREAPAFVPNSTAPAVRKLGQTAQERVVVRALDADFRGLEYGEIHWDVARTLLDRVRPAPSGDDTVRQWYRATLAYLASEGFFAESKPHVARALELFPDDPKLLFAHGCMQVEMASPGVQDFVAATVLPRGVRMDVESAGGHLSNAARLFERALVVDPALDEARVRLARVRFDQGKPKEALAILQEVAPRVSDPVVSYFAQLFLGDAAAALGEREPAAAAYRRAATLFPRAQTPRLALSQLARSTGNAAAAQTALVPMFALPGDPAERGDPWWDYNKGEGRYARTLLADLTRVVPASR
jgi:tetratricopeptide (TPR) repeat protein